MEAVTDLLFLGSKIMRLVTAARKLERLLLGSKAITNLDSVLKKQRHHFADKDPYS